MAPTQVEDGNSRTDTRFLEHCPVTSPATNQKKVIHPSALTPNFTYKTSPLNYWWIQGFWARASLGSLNSSVLDCWPYCASSTQTLLGNTWTLHQTERSSLGPALWPRQVTLPPEALVSSSLSIRLTVVLTSWDNVRIQLYDTQKMSQRSRRVEYLKSNSHFYSSHCAWCRNIADKDSSCFTPL